MAFSADAMKVLHPREVFSRFALAGTRPDGRATDASRKVGLNTATLTTCDGSAVVRLGGTTVAAGVQVVLAARRGGSAEPAVQVGLQISPASSSRFRRTGFVDPGAGRAACIAQMAASILLLPAVLDGAQFDVDATAFFRLEVDAVCTTFDGNVEDAALLAVVCAVATTVLPALRQRPDGSWGLAASAVAAPDTLPPADIRPARRVLLSCLPSPLSFACIRLAAAGAAAETADAHGSLVVVADPTADEESLGAGTVTAVVGIDLRGPQGGAVAAAPSRLLLVNAAGEPIGERETRSCAEAALAHASQRAAELRAAIETAVAAGER